MDRYIGIDAHKESCTMAVMGPTGRRIQELHLETNAKALKEALKALGSQRHVCLEEGELSAWLYELCEPLANRVVVVQAAKKLGSKSDSIDAWSLADQMRRGELDRFVFKQPGTYRPLREAVRCYDGMVQDSVRIKNRFGAVFRARGVQVRSEEIYSSSSRSKWLAKLPPKVRQRAALLGEELDGVMEARKKAETWLHEEAGKVPAVKLVATAPGIGVIRAAHIVAVVVCPERFRTSRQFWSYCGLAIVTRSSSDWVKDVQASGGWARKDVPQTRGLNRKRNPMLKSVFKGAALTVVQRQADHELTNHYMEMLKTTKPNLARLTIARKIAATVLAMWKNKEAYDPKRHERPARS
jgi:transposase